MTSNFIALMESLQKAQDAKKPKAPEPTTMTYLMNEKIFNGKSVCFAGGALKHYTRMEASDRVTALGGKVQSAITGSTHIVITPDKPEKSSKIDKAKKKGVTIMPEKDLYAVLKKNKAFLEQEGFSVPN